MGLIGEIKVQWADSPRPIPLPQYPRTALAELFRDMGYEVGVEIGTLAGRFAKVLLDGCPGLTLYCVDPWAPYADLKGDATQFQETESEARLRLRSYLKARFLKMTSMEALSCFDDNSIDFVYIDGGHDFINVAQDLHYWSKKVKSEGIVSGHDYVRTKNNVGHHVAEVVNAWTQAQQIDPWFTLGSHSDGLKGDKWRSYFWVKP